MNTNRDVHPKELLSGGIAESPERDMKKRLGGFFFAGTSEASFRPPGRSDDVALHVSAGNARKPHGLAAERILSEVQ